MWSVTTTGQADAQVIPSVNTPKAMTKCINVGYAIQHFGLNM